ncbi:MAG: 23S rRNA (adenine(2030)-N(6))-methyltransferase RlmJ [Deltaproteobacteria bacterium HGW-Deltaproteobacteria-4]|nr:MAG: 23S rRNA (adenine(2030)-N(6))-methyltransferase RlmJ [Deltaproteobacteria bacterium HGW-Deltaproteobacteria-4]
MLSYRHAFHAGNHADLLKHLVLVELLNYFRRKEKPFSYIDTHAGAGFYELDQGYATQNAEYAAGIGRLWKQQYLPAPLAAFCQQIRDCNPGPELTRYPGSPWLAGQLLRTDDRMWLFELHPRDQELLRATFSHAGKQVKITGSDGFIGLKGLLPPPTRRALVLIDPPYEEKRDYERVVKLLGDAVKRFASGTYALWYPQLQRNEAQALPARLKALSVPSWLHVSLTVQSPAADGFGMHGSGLFIVNPPYTLPATLQSVLPTLVELLRQDAGAGYSLEFSIP